MSLDPIEQLLTVEKEKLKDRKFLLSMIREHGLHFDKNIIHLYGEKNLPFVKKGGMIQMPEQLADALLYLSDKKIDKYFEVGTFNGQTTVFIVAYLTRFNPLLRAITIDNLRQWSNPYVELKIDCVLGTSDDFKGYKSDLCFIDGDHSLRWIQKDYNNVGRYARYCMFHDILETERIRDHDMDVKEFWDFMKTPQSKEFITGGRFGLGIL